MAAYVFLGLNGFRLTAPEAEATAMVVELAAGDAAEDEFADWIAAAIEAR